LANVIRNPRYWLSLAVLIGVIVVSAAKGGSGSSGSSVSAQPTVAATVSNTATVAPTASPVVPSTADIELDRKRVEDLGAIAGVLESYRTKNGAYPSTHNEFGTVCDMPFDAGCQLVTISKTVPVSDGKYPYWWQSDGAAYTLFTRVQTLVAVSGCPSIVPPPLIGLNLVCRTGGRR
jgi:hypothetical protein